MAEKKSEHDIRQSVAFVPEMDQHMTVWYDAKERIDFTLPGWYTKWLAGHPITKLIARLKMKRIPD